MKDYRPNGTTRPDDGPTSDRRPGDPKEVRAAALGGSVIVKGEITGSEDLTIDGRVEGRIDLPDHVLTIGPNATIQANIVAKVVTIFGSITGTIKARERLDVRKTASVEGTLSCGRITIQEGAHVSGKVETQGQRKPGAANTNTIDKPALAPVA